MTVSVFIGFTVNRFIARPNGDLDFLSPGGGEPHGYDEFMASVDALAIGRKTYETVLTFAAWPYGDRRVVVLSSRPLDLPAPPGGIVEQMAGPPAEIISKLAARGAHHLYVERRDHGSTVPARRRRSASHYHSRTSAHWRRNSALRHATARYPAPSRSDSALPKRFG